MKIAIIGSGISGLGSAYLLGKEHDITIYEKNDYIGGHSRTVDVKIDGKDIAVDTGFIVFNYRNYPNLSGLFNHLGVKVAKSDMSFGVSIDNGRLEYGTRRPFDIFAQKRNLLRPKYWEMLFDILKFNKNADKYVNRDITLGKLLDELGTGDWFRNYYLLAMGAAIWSTPTKGMLDFPAKTFIKFFDNHGLLTVNDQPQWYTVEGGSKEYVKIITKKLTNSVRLSCGVEKIIRKESHVEILSIDGKKEKYDAVICACHSDQALKMLDEPTADEQKILQSIKYQPNEMYLHSDTTFMQKRQGAWSSWVYLSEGKEDNSENISLSYWMNNLQPLETDKTVIVTLNPHRKPDESVIYDHYTFEHPVFDDDAIKAQENIEKIQGKDKIWYTGAWLQYGFHEDGLSSAVKVAKKLGAKIPWQ
ncbi:MAG: FAD-dependent oxidoreductase [Rickettsiales bacterium]|nr:FAD-dependent oxidoreductase [Pseudomonadota bacterium]MDA0966205.1 FAD-dependent oxidoreductase [Pseudomonadota bacterium]MDG4543130.1 FAD-dependent oxidoreductase [Rickettsiales bacterium]MDG4545328.1 FAD-dependent oxidoreductase [Rickettsiales bacterium]MDG4547777.1 FAD-dependent oxidoreductase [Rickettsiales bacterium]